MTGGRNQTNLDAIHRKKLKVFSTSTPRSVSQGKQQVASLKNDLQLFLRLYIGCQMRGGNPQEFFRHENQACRPSFSLMDAASA